MLSEPLIRPEVVKLSLCYGDALSKIAALSRNGQKDSKNKRMNDVFRWQNTIAILHELSLIGRDIPWEDLSDNELRILGFKLWEEDKPLRLVPSHLFASLPAGIKLTAIDGEVVVLGQSEIDLDTRLGCIPYGLIGKDRR